MLACVSEDADVEKEDILKLWAEYRAYAVHESLLVHQRLQRILIIQGFLFTAQGTLLPKLADLSSAGVSTPASWSRVVQILLFSFFALLIAVCGASSARVIQRALKAACDASDSLQEKWDKVGLPYAEALGLPALRGGGSPDADLYGKKHVLLMPVIFFWSWLLLGSALFLAVGVYLILIICRPATLAGAV